MGHHEPLCRIDIPKARAQILKSIAEYRRFHALATLVEGFLRALPAGKTLNSRAGDKLALLLQEAGPSLKVFRVTFRKSNQMLSDLPEYRFGIAMYDIEPGERSFLVRTMADGSLNIDDALIADRRWEQHANFLEERLKGFAYHAGKFNDTLDALRSYSTFALMEGDHYPVHPLGDYFHWYQLNNPSAK